jgi:hypothetical protein
VPAVHGQSASGSQLPNCLGRVQPPFPQPLHSKMDRNEEHLPSLLETLVGSSIRDLNEAFW